MARARFIASSAVIDGLLVVWDHLLRAIGDVAVAVAGGDDDMVWLWSSELDLPNKFVKVKKEPGLSLLPCVDCGDEIEVIMQKKVSY